MFKAMILILILSGCAQRHVKETLNFEDYLLCQSTCQESWEHPGFTDESYPDFMHDCRYDCKAKYTENAWCGE